MKLLQEMMEITSTPSIDPKYLETQLKELQERYGRCLDVATNIVTESIDVDQVKQQADAKLTAAKRGLGLANKLKDKVSKKMHSSRIMGNMNRLARNGLGRARRFGLSFTSPLRT